MCARRPSSSSFSSASCGERQELELVGVLERLAGEVGLRRGKGFFEIGLGLSLALVEVALDPVSEDAAAPAVLDGFAGVPQSRGQLLDLLDEHDVVPPGNPGHGLGKTGLGDLSHSLWDNFAGVAVREVEGPHPVEVRPRESAQSWKGPLQVVAETIEHGLAPTVDLLALDDARSRSASRAR